MMSAKNPSPHLDSSAKEEILQFVTFELFKLQDKGLTMALNVQKVKEAVQFSDLSPMPSGCKNLLGLYDLRGCPIPIVDVLSLISNGKKTHLYDEKCRLLICELQNVWIGVPVTKTGRIFSCSHSQFLPPPIGAKVEDRKIITGLIRQDSHYIPVLDLDSLLDAIALTEDIVEQSMPTVTYPGKRVLLVDDSKIVLKKMQKLFQSLECFVDIAENGEEALKKLELNSQYDLIFTDIEMPLLDGIAFARKVKANPQQAHIPILFNSALSNPALISDIEKEKLGRYLVKFDADLIIKHLQLTFSNN